MKDSKKKIIITGVGLDFPEGYAPTNQATEISKGFQSLGYHPLMIPIGKSKLACGDVIGEHQGIDYQYLSKLRNIGDWVEKIPGSGILIPIFNSLYFTRFLFQNRKCIGGVFDLSNHTLPLLIMVLSCRIAGVSYTYFLWEEVFTHRIHRQSNPLLRLLHWCIALFERPLLYGLVLRGCDQLCYLTTEFQDFMKNWGFNEKHLIAFPVVKFSENENTSATNFGSTKDNPYIVYSGTINSQKDEFLVVLNALYLLKEEYPNLRFRIFGNRDEAGSKSLIVKEAKALGIEHQIVFEGWVDASKLKDVQRGAAACLVLKTNCVFNRFNFPSRVLEYMESGTPMIMSRHSNHLALFNDHKDALLVDSEDPHSIATAIRSAIEDSNLCITISGNARRLLRSKFDAVSNLRQMLGRNNYLSGGEKQVV